MSKLNIEVPVTIGLKGRYNLVVKHADGTETETGWFNNLILNSGLDLMAHPGFFNLEYSVVGTSNTTPVATQTALVAMIGVCSGGQSYISLTNSGTPNYQSTITWDYTWTVGAVVGTIAEIGVGPNTNGTGLFSRALILDNLGSPTTLTLLVTDQLIAYYQVIVEPPITSSTGSFTLSAVSYGYTIQPAFIAGFCSNHTEIDQGNITVLESSCTVYGTGATMGAITGTITGATGTSVPATVTALSYTSGNFYRDYTQVMSTAQGNVSGGILGMEIQYGPYFDNNYQMIFTPAIPKTASNQLTMTFRLAWTN